MKHPALKIEKTEPASQSWGDYGADSPQGPGDWRWRHPASYQVTGPTGQLYRVGGSPSSWMQRPNWWYQSDGQSKGGFRSMTACIAAIAKLEQVTP
jgi:hypothetical protein